MKTKIFKNRLEVANRLRDLGLMSEQVISIAHAMIEGRDSSTMNDPSSAPGYFSWSYGTRKLREELLLHGWKRKETAGVPSVVQYDTKVSISVIEYRSGNRIRRFMPTVM